MRAGSWNDTEIALLKAAVARFGQPSTDAEWRRISDAVGTRDSKKCYQKWLHLASPPTPKWTAQHDTEIKRRRVEVSQKNAFMEGWERAELHTIRRPCWYNDKP